MQSNVPQNYQVDASSLPASTAVSQSVPPVPTESTNLSLDNVVAHAKQLIAQYNQDPAKLNAAISELKSNYIMEQFNVAPSTVET